MKSAWAWFPKDFFTKKLFPRTALLRRRVSPGNGEVGSLRELPCDTHVILASGACWGGTRSTPERSRSVDGVDDGAAADDDDAGVDGDGGQGSTFYIYKLPVNRPMAAASIILVLLRFLA